MSCLDMFRDKGLKFTVAKKENKNELENQGYTKSPTYDQSAVVFIWWWDPFSGAGANGSPDG